MEKIFELTLRKINFVRSSRQFLLSLFWVLRSLFFASFAFSVWIAITEKGTTEGFLVAMTLFVLFLLIDRPKIAGALGEREFYKALESSFPDTKHAVSEVKRATSPNDQAVAEWTPILDGLVEENKQANKIAIRSMLWTTLLPVFLLTLQFFVLPPKFDLVMAELDGIMRKLNKGATITVISGAVEEKASKPIKVNKGHIPTIKLLSKNLVQFEVAGSPPGKPSILLKKGDKVFQSFQMSPIFDANSGKAKPGRFEISFAVERNLELFVPMLDGSSPLAVFEVTKLSVPVVKLRSISRMTDPWNDDRPLRLRIEAESRAPLRTVSLLIRTGKRESRELVSNILAKDKTSIDTEYSLVLESYVESDLAEVEIIAEAVDQAVPSPLVGYSKPLQVKTASAYGRYQQALQTLRQVKEVVDKAVMELSDQLPLDLAKLNKKAQEQAGNTPFFDGLDRFTISSFTNRLTNLIEKPNYNERITVQSELNEFLFEHEMLDHRERDRDFFVAARTLSRVLEQPVAKRPVEVGIVTERVKKYLDERDKFWKIRLSRVSAENKPTQADDVIDNKPFHQAMDKIGAMGESDISTQGALTKLSDTVGEYRKWIEELEAAEEASRKQQEQKRQQGLANARNELRELQVEQGKISQKLDKAAERDKSEIADSWMTTRMKQKTNASKTGQLEAKMRALSPEAAARVKAAQKAMENAIETGDGERFVEAESYSDVAGRLLRQASKSTQRSQKQKRRSGRRRRVAGDNYYGQSIVGGDVEIKREYKVDRQYREDILDEVSRSGASDEDRDLMENYLRKIVR